MVISVESAAAVNELHALAGELGLHIARLFACNGKQSLVDCAKIDVYFGAHRLAVRFEADAEFGRVTHRIGGLRGGD